jgi:hypothetical protein
MSGWLVFREETYHYEFSYPPEATIITKGVTSFPSEALPPNMTGAEYLAELRQTLPGSLCVSVQYDAGFLDIQPAENENGAFAGPCGVTGVGDYEVTESRDGVRVGTEVYDARRFLVREQDAEATLRGEFYMLWLEDGTRIDFGGAWANLGRTYADYEASKAVLVKVLVSFRRIGGGE